MAVLQIKALEADQITQIHAATLQVLEKTGVKVLLPEAVELLRRAGARVEGDGLVKIPPALVEEAIEAAPEALTIFDRTGAEAMRLEGRNTYYGTGPTTPLVYDPYTGERRETDTPDIENAALICDALENIDFVMSMGISGGSDPAVHGIKPEMTDRFDFKAMLTHTTKPNVFLAYSLQGLIDIHDMAAAVVGSAHELRERPFAIHYSEPTSPLVHDSSNLEKLLFCADKAMPVIYVGGPLMGGTAPVTLAGQLVVSNAECLSGLVIHQLKAQGSPFIYGAGGNPLDMKSTEIVYAGPDSNLSNMAATELARHYGLPDFSIGGVSDAKVMGGQMAWEAGFSLLQAEMVGSNIVHNIGYMESGMTASWELIVLCDEIIGELRHFSRGIEVNERTLAVDIINQTGPGGSYLTQDHTFEHFRSIWYPTLRSRDRFEKWQKKGGKTSEKSMNDKVKRILENHHPKPLSPETMRSIESIMRRAEKID